ncbi:hypothetical protein [Thalassomonas actiniarum]|uniref:Uncharacterized protein n=1 Tax=Thalassomonas actiniarum TaxID=485447 RepID=A0AAE9YZQ1_9GAMM|nr:hypothetical protein [Thalassomonas actiniarum]WDE02582.1 hypothetical protein SG35_029705 [Thalassomonas actiniarum]
MIKVLPWLKVLGLLGGLLPTIGYAHVDIADEQTPFEVKKGTRFGLCNDVAAYINNHRDYYDTNPRELFIFKTDKFNKPKSTPSTKERYIQLVLQSVAHSKIRLTGFNSWKKKLERIEQRMQEQLEVRELMVDINNDGITDRVLSYSHFNEKFKKWYFLNYVLNEQGNLNLTFERGRASTGELFYYDGRTYVYRKKGKDVLGIYPHGPFYTKQGAINKVPENMLGLNTGDATCEISLTHSQQTSK